MVRYIGIVTNFLFLFRLRPFKISTPPFRLGGANAQNIRLGRPALSAPIARATRLRARNAHYNALRNDQDIPISQGRIASQLCHKNGHRPRARAVRVVVELAGRSIVGKAVCGVMRGRDTRARPELTCGQVANSTERLEQLEGEPEVIAREVGDGCRRSAQHSAWCCRRTGQHPHRLSACRCPAHQTTFCCRRCR